MREESTEEESFLTVAIRLAPIEVADGALSVPQVFNGRGWTPNSRGLAGMLLRGTPREPFGDPAFAVVTLNSGTRSD